MKIVLNQDIKQINGKSLLDEENKKVALKGILVKAALTDIKEDDPDKVKDFKIALKIESESKDVELSNTELSRLQKKVGLLYPTLIVGQVNELLEGNKNPLIK